jgi:hypothetical protein
MTLTYFIITLQDSVNGLYQTPRSSRGSLLFSLQVSRTHGAKIKSQIAINGAAITGAASEVGLALTKHLGKGWRVVMTNINENGEIIAKSWALMCCDPH